MQLSEHGTLLICCIGSSKQAMVRLRATPRDWGTVLSQRRPNPLGDMHSGGDKQPRCSLHMPGGFK